MNSSQTDTRELLIEMTALRKAFFEAWKAKHPNVFSDDEWTYINIYYDVSNTDEKWKLLVAQDEGLMNALERFAHHKFYLLLQYVYAVKPSTYDLEFVTEFSLHPGEGESFKLRVGPKYKYFWRGEDRSECDFLKEIIELEDRAKQLKAILKQGC